MRMLCTDERSVVHAATGHPGCTSDVVRCKHCWLILYQALRGTSSLDHVGGECSEVQCSAVKCIAKQCSK